MIKNFKKETLILGYHKYFKIQKITPIQNKKKFKFIEKLFLKMKLLKKFIMSKFINIIIIQMFFVFKKG